MVKKARRSRRSAVAAGRPLTVFIDRDGVLNREPGKAYYVRRPSGFRWNPGVFGALQRLSASGAKLVVVSNQAGIGRGLVTPAALDAITRKMFGELAARGVVLSGVFYCTCAPEAGCDCRKPKTGMFKAADRLLRLGRGRRFMIGDTERDIVAGHRAGCRAVLVLSGKTRTAGAAGLWAERPDHICQDLKGAVTWILAQKRS